MPHMSEAVLSDWLNIIVYGFSLLSTLRHFVNVVYYHQTINTTLLSSRCPTAYQWVSLSALGSWNHPMMGLAAESCRTGMSPPRTALDSTDTTQRWQEALDGWESFHSLVMTRRATKLGWRRSRITLILLSIPSGQCMSWCQMQHRGLGWRLP